MLIYQLRPSVIIVDQLPTDMPKGTTSGTPRGLTAEALKKLKLRRAIDKEKQGIDKVLRERAKILAKRQHMIDKVNDDIEAGGQQHERNIEGIKKDVKEQWEFDRAEKLRWEKGLKKKKKKQDTPPRCNLIIPPAP